MKPCIQFVLIKKIHSYVRELSEDTYIVRVHFCFVFFKKKVVHAQIEFFVVGLRFF